MKVAHVVPTYYPAVKYGGPIRSVHGLCAALSQIGHDVAVFTTSMGASHDMPAKYVKCVTIDGVQVNYHECAFPRRIYRSPGLSTQLSGRASAFDVMHLHSVFLWPTYRAARIASSRNMPYVVSPRGMLVKDLIKRRGRLRKLLWIAAVEKRNLEGAGFVHATSELEAKELQAFGFDLKGIDVIPNGVSVPSNLSRILANRDRRNRPREILYLGRLNWKKGLERLIHAIPHTSGCCKFVIAGGDEEGYRAKLEKLAMSLGVRKQIEFTGELSDELKWARLAAAFLVVLPSHQESFGNVVLEAMAASTPVVATREVGAGQLVAEAQAGVVVTGDPVRMAKVFDELLANPEMANNMGTRGQAAALNRHSWRSVACAMANRYESLVRPPGTMGRRGA